MQKANPQTKALTVHQVAIQKLNHPDMHKAIKAVLPKHMPVEAYLAIAAAEIKGKSLQKVQDYNSIILSVFHAAKLGLSLNPHMGEAYLVPYSCKQPDGSKKTIAQFIPGYQGLAKLVRQADLNGVSVIDIKGFCVHENDEFDYSVDGDDGVTVRFRPNLIKKPGKRIAAFSMAKYSNGFVSYHVVPGYKVEEIREKALRKTRGYGPWKDNEDEMWVKTPIRHHAKFLPKSERLAMAIMQDEIFEGKPVSSQIPEELANTGLVDEAEYEEIVSGNNEVKNDRSTKPETEAPKAIEKPAATKKAEKKKVEKEPEAVPADTEPTDPKAEYLETLRATAMRKGVAKDIDDICMAEFGYTSADMPFSDWDTVLEHFNDL